MKDLARTELGNKKKMPFDRDPQIQQQQGQGHVEQAQADRGGGSASPHRIHQPIAGFDAETMPIDLKDLLGLDFELNNDQISNVIATAATIAPFAVLGDDHDGERLRPIFITGSGVGGLIAAPALQQSADPALLAANGQGDDGRKGLQFEIGHHPIVVKAAIQIESPHPQAPKLAGES